MSPSLLGLIPVASGSFDGYSTVVGKSPIAVCAADTNRTNLTVRNLSNLYPLFVGTLASLQAGGGFPLMPGQTLSTKVTGVLYAVVGTTDTVLQEVTVGMWWER